MFEEQFLDFMMAHGAAIPRGQSLRTDGRIGRARRDTDGPGETSFGYFLHVNGRPNGVLMDWHETDGRGKPRLYKWLPDGEWAPPTPAEKESRRREREHLEKVRAAERVEHLEKARTLYDSAPAATSENAYLKAKGVFTALGLREAEIEKKPNLLIPLFNVESGAFQALHRIFPGKEKFHKRFVTGTSGGVFTIPARIDIPAGVICCEGVGTALSIHEALEGHYVVLACMNAGNITANVESIRAKYEEMKLYLGQDVNDNGAGARVAEHCKTAGWTGALIPDLANKTAGSDWNDYHTIHGIEATGAALLAEIERAGFAKDAESAPRDEQQQPSGTTLGAIEIRNACNFQVDVYEPKTSRARTDEKQNVRETGWNELILFEQCDALPQFPIEVLPSMMRDYINSASESIQAPLDMVGPCALGVVEIACQGRYPVQLPNGHIEQGCLYIAPIAPPSERKSGVIDVVTRPLIDFEIQYNQEHAGKVNQSRSDLRLLQGRIASAEQQAIKEKDAGKRKAAEWELQALNTELAEFKAIEPLRLYGADVTPEKLGLLLQSQDGVFALVSAEGGGLFENIGRYSDKGGLELYLNGYSGDRVCIDRKMSGSIVINKPTLSIIAPVQPSVIADLFSDKQKSGRGLLSRILFVKCHSRVGSRKAISRPLDERIAANYRDLCHHMLNMEEGENLVYDADGFNVYKAFFEEIEPQLKPDTGELSFMADWAGKLHGQMTRLAGLIHCINAFEQGKSPTNTAINAYEASAAVELARFYLAHARAVYSEQAESPTTSNARYLWGKILSLSSSIIDRRELTRKTQGKKDFDLEESINTLVERGYIRIDNVQTGGRPSPKIIINPEIEGYDDKSDKSDKSPRHVAVTGTGTHTLHDDENDKSDKSLFYTLPDNPFFLEDDPVERAAIQSAEAGS